ncbi:MAG TPA: dihydrodipicolinate synthase family protein [Candidatus Dormibacteraeota bacterium]|nr:dihydrodipicolinate synthase family protein [Candidatus Dormibacteraeota bacterium]
MFKIEELHGVLPALVTPLTEDGAPDELAIGRVVEQALAGGAHGLLALGSTGEGASLDEPTRRKTLAGVVGAAAGRVPVICGVAQSHLAAASAEVKAAAGLGAVAALVTPPFYYPIDQATVLAFYRRLAAESPLPILVYNIPQFTKVVIEPATLAALAREGAIAGIKDSSRDFEYFERVCLATRDLPAFRIFTGSDTMLIASLVMGGAGTICAAANIAPQWVVSLYDAVKRGDLDAARRGQDLLIELGRAVGVGVFPSAFKAALHLQGVCDPWPAPPVAPLDEASKARLKERLAAFGLLAAVPGVSA